MVLLKVAALLPSGLLPAPPTRSSFHMVKITCLLVGFGAPLPQILSLIPTSSRNSLGRTFATTVAKLGLSKTPRCRNQGPLAVRFRRDAGRNLAGCIFTRGPLRLLPCTFTCEMLSNTQPLFLCDNTYQLLLK